MSDIRYDPNVDYREKINEAKTAGNYERASILEAMRNAKIEGERLGYAPTYEFTPRVVDNSAAGGEGAYLKELYSAKKKKALAALRAEYEKNVSVIDRAIDEITAAYKDARNRAAAGSERSARDWNERAAAGGLMSLGGQAERARANALEGEFSELDAERSDKTAAREQKKSALRDKYDKDAAKLREKSDEELRQAIYKEYQRRTGASKR